MRLACNSDRTGDRPSSGRNTTTSCCVVTVCLVTVMQRRALGGRRRIPMPGCAGSQSPTSPPDPPHRQLTERASASAIWPADRRPARTASDRHAIVEFRCRWRVSQGHRDLRRRRRRRHGVLRRSGYAGPGREFIHVARCARSSSREPGPAAARAAGGMTQRARVRAPGRCARRLSLAALRCGGWW